MASARLAGPKPTPTTSQTSLLSYFADWADIALPPLACLRSQLAPRHARVGRSEWWYRAMHGWSVDASSSVCNMTLIMSQCTRLIWSRHDERQPGCMLLIVCECGPIGVTVWTIG